MVTFVRISRVRRIPLALLLVGIMSCGGSDGGGTTAPDPPRATKITISQTSASLSFLGQTIVFTATIVDQFQRPFNATVTWSSDDPSVVTVTAGGQAAAVDNGVTTIRATSGSLTASASVTVAQVATRVSVVSGNAQVGIVGQALAQALVARSEDQGGAPVPGASVTFTVDNGNGAVSQSTATTDAEAKASTMWTLGTTSGTQEVTAAIAEAVTGFALFGATAQAGAPTAFAKSSGDQQSGTVGVALSSPLVVKLVDEFGNGVVAGSVTFTVTGGSGSVTPSQMTTGDDGNAQATWTLGPAVGANTLSATAPNLPAVMFTANAAAAKADLQPGAVVTTPTNITSLQTFDVTSTVTNVGHLPTGAGFQVQLLIDGNDAGTTALPALSVGGSADATFTVGPLAAGFHTLRMVADVGGAVDESNEGNNAIEQSKTVAAATLVTAGTSIDEISGALETEQLFTLEVPASSPGTVVISLSGGTGDVDLYVHHGSRPASRDDYECQSGNPDTTERCVINAAEPGTYHILLYAFSPFSGTSLLATTGGPVIPFDIELVFLDRGTATQDAAVVEAAARWMSILPSDITDVDFASSPVEINKCIDGQPLIDDSVDDIRIYVKLDSIDGPGGTLGQAGPCILRGLSELPIIGSMEFDVADLTSLENSGELLSVILHEMGHVLGLGTIWGRLEMLNNPSLPSSSGADTHFPGTRAIAAFDAAGGTNYTGGEKVPVENQAGEGSGDSHWRESVLGTELMTPFLNSGGSNPLSAISIQSMADLGYRVDVTQAEAYNNVFRAPSQTPITDRFIDLRGDVRTGPIYVVDAKGRVVEVIRR